MFVREALEHVEAHQLHIYGAMRRNGGWRKKISEDNHRGTRISYI